MESNHIAYDYNRSDERIQEIINSAETFEQVDSIPARSKLTYSNGFYVNCTAVFIDIRDSSKLPESHTRPVAGKIYRAFLSECVAVMNGESNCSEVFINGDCVSGIFDTPYTPGIDSAFEMTARLNSLTQILNFRLEKKRYQQIRCGIGMDYGRALMLKAGYSGSGLNDVIWMGDVVNGASNLCHQGNKGGRMTIQISSAVRHNLKEDYKNFLSAVPNALYPTHYECDVIDSGMDAWLQEQKNATKQQQGLASLLIR